MQIMGLFEIYFDAVVVKVETFLLLFRFTLAILWRGRNGFLPGQALQKIAQMKGFFQKKLNMI